MDTVSCRRRVRSALVPGVLAALLAACGGGGGGDGGPPGSIDVSASNQDVLVRTGIVAIQGDVVGGALSLASGPGQSAPLARGLRKQIAALGSPVAGPKSELWSPAQTAQYRCEPSHAERASKTPSVWRCMASKVARLYKRGKRLWTSLPVRPS